VKLLPAIDATLKVVTTRLGDLLLLEGLPSELELAKSARSFIVVAQALRTDDAPAQRLRICDVALPRRTPSTTSPDALTRLVSSQTISARTYLKLEDRTAKRLLLRGGNNG
jgi:hypothetical protein